MMDIDGLIQQKLHFARVKEQEKLRVKEKKEHKQHKKEERHVIRSTSPYRAVLNRIAENHMTEADFDFVSQMEELGLIGRICVDGREMIGITQKGVDLM